MGNAQGGGSGGAGQPPKSGWRILKVCANSPCSNVGLVPYFDVLTHVNGQALGTDKSEQQLYHLIADKEHVPTTLTVLSYTTKAVRDVVVTPNRAWGGAGLVGLVIRYDTFEHADCDTFHVLDVHPGSPAERAGLHAHTDYLLGTADICFKGNDELDFFLTKYDGVPTALFVYNAKTHAVREVTITVNSKWGGKGALGCDVGWGILHRLPLRDVAHVTVEGAATTGAGAGTTAAPAPYATPTAGPVPVAVASASSAAAAAAAGEGYAFPPPALFAVPGGVVLRLRIATGERVPPLELDLRLDCADAAAPVAAAAAAPIFAAAAPVYAAAAPAYVAASQVAQYVVAAPPVAAVAQPIAPVVAVAQPVAVAPVAVAPVVAEPVAPVTPVRPPVAAAAVATTPAVAVASPAVTASPAVVVSPAAAAPAPTAAFNPAAFASPYRPFAPAGTAAASPAAVAPAAGGAAAAFPAFNPAAFNPTAFTPAPFTPAAFTPAPFTPAPFTPKPFTPFQFTPFNPNALAAGAGAGIGTTGGAAGVSPFAAFTPAAATPSAAAPAGQKP